MQKYALDLIYTKQYDLTFRRGDVGIIVHFRKTLIKIVCFPATYLVYN